MGIDLVLNQTFGRYETQLSYTLSKQLNAFDNIFQGRYFPDNDHRTHQVKWLNNYTFYAFEFYCNTIYSSGKPYINASRFDNNRPRKDLDPKKDLDYLPPYFRIDLGLQYKPEYFKDKLKLGISVFNLLNRQNVYSIQNIKPVGIPGQNAQEYIPVGAESTLLKRTLNLNLNFRF